MYIKELHLRDFRNYTDTSFVFSPEINRIEGKNGSGKSNLLEAIHLLATGKSFRTFRTNEIIAYNSSGFAIRSTIEKESISHNLDLSFSQETGRKAVLNEATYTSFLPLLGILPLTILSPEDIAIISGSPSDRRRFIDLYIAMSDSVYVHHLGRYQKALQHRNFLLKTGGRGFEAWEELMAVSGTYIVQARIEVLLDLERKSREFLSVLSKNQEEASIHYKGLSTDAEGFKRHWRENRPKELIYKTTLSGPHRDEILFSVGGKELKSYASEGQKRCFLAALRLSQRQRQKELLGNFPPFGIDDFGVHLDAERSSLLEELLSDTGQVFLTAPSFSSRSTGKSIFIRKGTAEKEDLSNAKE